MVGWPAPDATTLPGILAEHLRFVHQHLSDRSTPAEVVHHALSQVYTDKSLLYLRSKGYDPTDVATWAWIITAESAECAALRMLAVDTREFSSPPQARRTPIFVLMFVLRREKVTGRALKALVALAWNRLDPCGTQVTKMPALTDSKDLNFVESGLHSPLNVCQPSPTDHLVPGETTLMTLFVRLIRHARKVWPQAIITITDMVINELRKDHDRSRMETTVSARLAMLHNRMLALLASPSTVNSFLNNQYHQRAQFNVIGRMAEFDPPLAITQEGYRAVIKIQTAHRKTFAERQWADKKARSWPPWKEERLGIDASNDPIEGSTRALEAIARMREAGYANGRWEEIVQIYAGWDTDGTPTIQKRLIFPNRGPKPLLRDQKQEAASENDDAWAARIRATRTVQEAWSCFLNREDIRRPLSQAIFLAMFEKLAFERKRSRAAASLMRPALEIRDGSQLPGDGLEVFAPPTSPQEALYLRSDPPKLLDLFHRMIRDGVRPSPRTLVFLVSHAESIPMAIEILRHSKLMDSESLRAMSDFQYLHSLQIPSIALAASENGVVKVIADVPLPIFSAFIKALSRFNWPSVQVKAAVDSDLQKRRSSESSAVAAASHGYISNIQQAFLLMRLRKPHYRPPWDTLLMAISCRGAVVSDGGRPGSVVQDILSWRLTQETVRHMKSSGLGVDFQGFHSICRGLEKAIMASWEVRDVCRDRPLDAADDKRNGDVRCLLSDDEKTEMLLAPGDILDHGPRYIKSIFDGLVGSPLVPPGTDQDPRPDEPTDDPADLRIDLSRKLPPLLAIPSPANLHVFARVLGLTNDHDGLAALLDWMARFSKEIEDMVNEVANGARQLRRALIATRMFLENGPCGLRGRNAPGHGPVPQLGADKALIEHVKRMVKSKPTWGGWPDDAEVEDYYNQVSKTTAEHSSIALPEGNE